MSNNLRQLILNEIYNTPELVKPLLERVVSTGIPASIKGEQVDKYTASMILTVAKKLTEDNQRVLFSKPLNEMVALTYKILSY
jgi:hypothetical protein